MFRRNLTGGILLCGMLAALPLRAELAVQGGAADGTAAPVPTVASSISSLEAAPDADSPQGQQRVIDMKLQLERERLAERAEAWRMEGRLEEAARAEAELNRLTAGRPLQQKAAVLSPEEKAAQEAPKATKTATVISDAPSSTEGGK